MKDHLKGMLGRPIQSGRQEGHRVLFAFADATVVFGTTAGCDHPLSSVVRKCAQHLEASAHPLNVLPCLPEFSWHRIPCKVQQARWPHFAEEFSGATRAEQICLVPDHIRKRDPLESSSGERM